MRLPRMTTRRWMIAVAVVALVLAIIPMILLVINDAAERGVFEPRQNLEGWPD